MNHILSLITLFPLAGMLVVLLLPSGRKDAIRKLLLDSHWRDSRDTALYQQPGMAGDRGRL